jgi:nucleotide-binding universal stress UspA family protein
MFDHIIVPLDGSELSTNALVPAQQIAATYSARIVLVRAIQEQQFASADPIGNIRFWPDTPAAELKKHAEKYLEGVADNLDYPTTVYADVGDPAQVILDVAERPGRNLIVMSTHGYTGFSRWLYGSVTARVMPYAPCPILVVRSAEIPQHILLALDCSRFAEHILDPTLALVNAFDANITFLHVEERGIHHDEKLEAMIAKNDTGLAERYRTDFYDESHKYLRHVAARYPNLNIEIHVARGKPAQRIVEMAEQLGCDLIAMSTHGHTGVARWRYGSVTNKVLSQAPVDLLISRPADL